MEVSDRTSDVCVCVFFFSSGAVCVFAGATDCTLGRVMRRKFATTERRALELPRYFESLYFLHVCPRPLRHALEKFASEIRGKGGYVCFIGYGICTVDGTLSKCISWCFFSYFVFASSKRFFRNRICPLRGVHRSTCRFEELVGTHGACYL